MNIDFVTGVMGAGKSERLILDERKYFNESMRSAVVKISPKKDSKIGKVESRSGKYTECLNLNIGQTEAEVIVALSKYVKSKRIVDFILVDEAQFLTPMLIEAIENVAQIFETNIVFYGLLSDFRGKTFEGSAFIMDICDNLIPIEKQCEKSKCDRSATHNARYVNNVLVIKGKQIVEDKEYYKALCPMCFYAESKVYPTLK